MNIVWGALDEDLGVGQEHRLHEVLPGSRLRIIDDAHHNLPIDDPAAGAHVLLSTVSRAAWEELRTAQPDRRTGISR